MSQPSVSPNAKTDFALRWMQALIGEWAVVGAHPMIPTGVRGRAVFKLLEDSLLLVMRTEFEQPGPPNAEAVIGGDDSSGEYKMLYFDQRGVSRIYQVGFEADTWRMWRDAPGFSQRFTVKFLDQGDRFAGRWELSKDGSTWEPDLELTYTKVR